MRHRFFSRLNYLENRLVAARVRPMLCRRRQDHSQLCEFTTRKLDRRNPAFWLVVRVGFPGCIKQHYTEHRARGGSQCSATSRRIPSPTGWGNFNGGMHLERSGEILGRFAVLTRIRRVIPHHRSFFLWDDFHFCGRISGPTNGSAPARTAMRQSACRATHGVWKRIDFSVVQWGSIAITQACSIDLPPPFFPNGRLPWIQEPFW